MLILRRDSPMDDWSNPQFLSGGSKPPTQRAAPRNEPIRIGMDQNIGASPKRRLLEDACFAETMATAGGSTITLAIVADGIGGESSGERAANLTVETIVDCVRETNGNDFPRILEAALRRANRAVFEEGQREEHKRDMGSTATVALIRRDRLFIASVGDSRAYLVRDGKAVQLTSDHTWGEEMVRMGKLRPQEAARNPHAKSLVRSIGSQPDVIVDLGLYWNAREDETAARSRQGTPLKAGDHVVLCSDGLIKERPDGRGHFVEAAEFPEILSRNPPLQAARTLISKAMGRNVNDNVSVVVLQKSGRASAIGKALPRRGLILAALVVILLAGAALLPSVLAQIQPRIPVVARPTIRIVESSGEGLYLESGQLPVKLQSNAPLPIHAEGTLQTLEGTIQFVLPDSSKIYLDRFSKITLMQLADPNAGERNNILTLEQGRLLIVSSPRAGFSSSITGSGNLNAQALGSILGATFDPAQSRLEADCLEGACLVANDRDVLHLSTGEYSWVRADGIGSVGKARYDAWYGLGGRDTAWITPTPPPTVTSTPTPAPTQKYMPAKATEAPPSGRKITIPPIPTEDTPLPQDTPVPSIIAPQPTMPPPNTDVPSIAPT
jgi:serine/threonine protein phosphatase PrpC